MWREASCSTTLGVFPVFFSLLLPPLYSYEESNRCRFMTSYLFLHKSWLLLPIDGHVRSCKKEVFIIFHLVCDVVNGAMCVLQSASFTTTFMTVFHNVCSMWFRKHVVVKLFQFLHNWESIDSIVSLKHKNLCKLSLFLFSIVRVSLLRLFDPSWHVNIYTHQLLFKIVLPPPLLVMVCHPIHVSTLCVKGVVSFKAALKTCKPRFPQYEGFITKI